MTDCDRPIRRHASLRTALAAATLMAVLGLAACSTPRGGYGLTGSAAADAAMRQQAVDQADRQSTPDDQQMYLSLIRDMQGKGLYFASLAHLDAYEQKYGSSPEVSLLRADALRETGQRAAAEAAYRPLLSTSVAAAAWHGLGLLAGQRKDYIGAVAALREAARRNPIEPLYLSDLGYALLRAGDAPQARVPIAQAAELAPANRKIISNLALYLLVSGDRHRADEVMAKAQLPAATREAIGQLARDIAQQPAPHAPSLGQAAHLATPVVVRLSDDRATPSKESMPKYENEQTNASLGNTQSDAAIPGWLMPPVLDRFARQR